jgi:hypothetical protein
MNAMRFDEPVYLTVGIGVPAEIGTVERAYALLNDWPVWRRNSAHAVALNACKAALAGEIDAETARTTLVAFAKRSNALAGDNRDMTIFASPVRGSKIRPMELYP